MHLPTEIAQMVIQDRIAEAQTARSVREATKARRARRAGGVRRTAQRLARPLANRSPTSATIVPRR
jgi:hypothetical protein